MLVLFNSQTVLNLFSYVPVDNQQITFADILSSLDDNFRTEGRNQ